VALLRRFEPVLRFTRGERFYPMDVEPYVRSCSLWVQRPGEEATRVVPHGGLTLETLGQQPRDVFGAVHFLRFTDPKNIGDIGLRQARKTVRRRRRDTKNPEEARRIFSRGTGRLARVGYASRMADAFYSLGLLARGRVPGEAAVAAYEAYEEIMAHDERYRYHGRVVRQDGWTVLQYWLFYPFNDWRSGFYGANDHEADWEKVFVYLSEADDGTVEPEWVAYASHNYMGDDLRRRRDDPEVEWVGEHPVVYVCAGSHASYYAAGEYLTELELSLPKPVSRTVRAVRTFWRERLGQYVDIQNPEERERSGTFRIPFVDYARGDGFSVGEGGEAAWEEPRMLDDPIPSWVEDYRGLFGLYARDPFEGEDAPAGPMYNRDKSVARAWHDPVGWAGLDKVPTRSKAVEVARSRLVEVTARRRELEAQVERKSSELKRLGVELAALRNHSHVSAAYRERKARLDALSAGVAGLRAQLASEEAVADELEEYEQRLAAGALDPVRAHIGRAQAPASDVALRTSRIAEVWAAVSVGLMIMALLAIAVFETEHLTFVLVASIALFAFVEAGFKGRMTNLVSSANIGLAVVATLVLLFEFFWGIIIFVVLIVGLYVLWDNLRELLR
jgi:hypothetical protein